MNTTPSNIKLFWYGPKPPISETIFHSTLQYLYVDACYKSPHAAGFLMLLRSTLFPADFPEYFNLVPDLYSVHVIPLPADILTQLIGTIQAVESSGEHFQYFVLS